MESRLACRTPARAPVLRHGMPCLQLSDCRVASLLAMTRNCGGFVCKQMFFVYAAFLRGIALRIVFQTFRSGNCSDFAQNRSSLSLRGGRVRPTRQSLTYRHGIPQRNMEKCNKIIRSNTRRHSLPHVSYYMDHLLPCVICFTSHSVLPCFATGCHTYSFQIAASLRSSQ